MSRRSGLSAEMRRLLNRFRADPLALDDDSADRLLAGRLDPADAPPGYAEAAAVMAAATAPATPDELDGVQSSLDAFRAVLAAPPPSPRRPNMLVKLLTVKAVAAVFTGALVVGGVAAAATGTLPEAAQRVAHRLVSAAPAPAGEEHAQTTSGQAAQSDTAKGPNLTGTARAGLCNAYMAGNGGASGGKNGSTAFQALEQAAGGTDKVADYCKDVTGSKSHGQAAGGAQAQSTSSATASSALELSSSEKAGLCKAWLKRNGSSAQGDAAAFEELEQAAGGADKIAAFCQEFASSATQQSGGGADNREQNLPPAGTDHGGGQP